MEEDQQDVAMTMLERISSGDSFAKLVGMKLLEVQSGFARASLEITEHIVNIHQMAHGGAVFSLADLACESAGNSFGEPAIALQTNIHFLAAGKCGDLLTATAKLTSRFESFGLIEFEIKNQEGRLVSTGQQTIIFRKQNKNLP